MRIEIPVSKYHGCGNDFILIAYDEVEGWSEEELKDLIISVCDRHTGIGADGCIFVRQNPLEMIYYNQDGSRADMCGNGIRCFANYCHDEGLVATGMYDVETLAGTRTVSEISAEPFRVLVGMGKPEWDKEKIGVAENDPVWGFGLETSQGQVPIYSVYMNTIHTVVFVDEPFDESLEALGKEICEHPMFAKQTNVNFVKVIDPEHIQAATYERGCGMTLACGTGMCASALITSLLHLSGKHVDIEMKRGTLHIDVDHDMSVYLSGEARRILKGTYEYDKKETA